MRRPEPQQRHAAVDVPEVVVGVRDVQLAPVLAAVVVAVPDQRGFEVVVEQRVADRQPVAAVAEVRQAVVVVFPRGEVGGEVAVVDPDVAGLLHADGVAAGVAGAHLGDRQVADDHVVGGAEEEAKARDGGGGVQAQDGFVGADADFLGSRDLAFDVDGYGGRFVFDGRGEIGVGGDGDDFAAGAAGCAAVLGWGVSWVGVRVWLRSRAMLRLDLLGCRSVDRLSIFYWKETYYKMLADSFNTSLL